MADRLEQRASGEPAAIRPPEAPVRVRLADAAAILALLARSPSEPEGGFIQGKVRDLLSYMTENPAESTSPEVVRAALTERVYSSEMDELVRRLDDGIGHAHASMDRLLAQLDTPLPPDTIYEVLDPELATVADIDALLERLDTSIADRSEAMDRLLAVLVPAGTR